MTLPERPPSETYRPLRQWQPDPGDKYTRPRGIKAHFRPVTDEEIENAGCITFVVFRGWLGDMPLLDTYKKTKNRGIERVR